MLAEAPDALDSFVRASFPTLASDWAFMDNAGGSVPLGSVIERAAGYLRECPVQLGASYAQSELAQHRLDEAAEALAEFTHARETREVIVGPSTSVLIARLARALAPGLQAGDEIIVTNADHEANISPWLRLEDKGVVLRTWSLNRDSLRLELDDLEALLNERTRLVCFTHTSNILGSIEPVAAITRKIHEYGAEVCVDGVAYAPHHPLDVQAWNVDYYVFSLYKVYGPHLAVMVGKAQRLEQLANLNHSFFTATDLPVKFQPGGANYELTYASAAVPDYYAELGRRAGAASGADRRTLFQHAGDYMGAREEALAAPLLDYLTARPDVRVIGSTSPSPAVRTPTISFVVEGRDSATVPAAVDAHKVAIRWGHFYAPRLIEHLGLTPQNGVVRASLVHYNTVGEVERLIAALDAVL